MSPWRATATPFASIFVQIWTNYGPQNVQQINNLIYSDPSLTGAKFHELPGTNKNRENHKIVEELLIYDGFWEFALPERCAFVF